MVQIKKLRVLQYLTHHISFSLVETAEVLPRHRKLYFSNFLLKTFLSFQSYRNFKKSKLDQKKFFEHFFHFLPVPTVPRNRSCVLFISFFICFFPKLIVSVLVFKCNDCGIEHSQYKPNQSLKILTKTK